LPHPKVRFFVWKPEEGSNFRRLRRLAGGKGRRMRPSKETRSLFSAARCGMRRGEIRGLQWGDIKEGGYYHPA
jgi:integrase